MIDLLGLIFIDLDNFYCKVKNSFYRKDFK